MSDGTHTSHPGTSRVDVENNERIDLGGRRGESRMIVWIGLDGVSPTSSVQKPFWASVLMDGRIRDQAHATAEAR